MSRGKQVRRVHINNKAWTYMIGDRFVSIRDPDGKRTMIPRSDLEVVSERRNGFSSHPMPQDVKDYIWARLNPVIMLKPPTGTSDAKAMLINLFCGARKPH